MMKKKGNALILALSVIALLSVLSLILASQASAAYNLTLKNEKRDKLSLMAESGVEKGLTALKQKIYNTPEIFNSNIPLAAANFEFTEESTKTSVSFLDIADYIDNGVRKGPCIKITSKATNNVNNTSKTMSAYILKSDISNVYYDAIFGNVITALDSVKGNTNKSFDMQGSLNPLILDGSMYLQGGEIDIRPYSFNYTSGKININSNSLTTNTANTSLVDKMYVNPATNVPADIKNKVKKLTPSLLPILNVKYNVPADASLQNFYADKRYTNDNPSYTVRAAQQTTTDNMGNQVTTLVTFKITKNNPGISSEFKWSDFVIDVKDYIMRNMIKIKGKGFTGEPNGNNYGDAFEAAYKGMYKLYVIDGDVNVKTPSNTSGYINHVIYSTGKCTFDKGGNPFIRFTNCSIMAKQIAVKDLRTSNYTYNNLELHGIKRLDEQISNGELSPFSAGNRASINKFLIQHLEGYADALRFKVYKWEEN